jgi:DNA-binding transcriptional LysR family regulator
MELRHLRYFIAVAEELSFSRAAVRLNVSQPPLSRQIRDLEDELNVKLFERNHQEVKLTTVGRALLIRARELVREAELLRTRRAKNHPAAVAADRPLHSARRNSPAAGTTRPKKNLRSQIARYRK